MASASRSSEQASRADKSVQAFRDALEKSITISLERLQEVLDDAVKRGRITRADAEELVDRFVEIGRQQNNDILSRLEAFVPGAGTVGRAVRGLKGDGGFPIDGYDDLTAAQINGELEGLSPADLRLVLDYEKKNANRKSVLNAVEKRLR
ncbi:MAG: hypothetical protein ACXWF9_13180 [Solirubrobacterales bacterium]